MEAKVIRTLRPNVTREEAIQKFSEFSLASLYWKVRGGTLQRIAEAYIPYRVYHVRFPVRGVQRARFFALDAVNGSLDLFEFNAAPGDAETISVSTRNHPTAMLGEARSEELLRDKILRLVFQQGFFKIGGINLEIERLPGEIYLPYWLGFYGAPENLRCRVLDAVRRRIEGARASALFEHWLAA